jgi:hypothetical protein
MNKAAWSIMIGKGHLGELGREISSLFKYKVNYRSEFIYYLYEFGIG